MKEDKFEFQPLRANQFQFVYFDLVQDNNAAGFGF